MAPKSVRDLQAACLWAEIGVVLRCSYCGRLRGDDKKRQFIDAMKAVFDVIIERGKDKHVRGRRWGGRE